MYLIVINHYKNAGMNGFYEEAILSKEQPVLRRDDKWVFVNGFKTDPSSARRAANGKDPYLNQYGKESTPEQVEYNIECYFNTHTKTFWIPGANIAYIEELIEL